LEKEKGNGERDLDRAAPIDTKWEVAVYFAAGKSWIEVYLAASLLAAKVVFLSPSGALSCTASGSTTIILTERSGIHDLMGCESCLTRG
jgi:hypothetical protein